MTPDKAPIPHLENIISLIVSEIAPDQIILFGSYALGNFTEKSDIDLLVLKKGLENEHKTCAQLYRAFCKNKEISKAIDVIVKDTDRYLKTKNCLGTLSKTINETGKVIYGNI